MVSGHNHPFRGVEGGVEIDQRLVDSSGHLDVSGHHQPSGVMED